MTDQERQESRKAKQLAIDKLSKIDLKAYHLKSIDKRLELYAKDLMSHPECHNGYELLGLARFFVLLDNPNYEFRINKAKEFITFYESLYFEGTNGASRYKLTPVQVFQFCSIMGFYIKSNGQRLTRNVLLFVPRKYSKTTSVASLAVYDFLFGDANGQAYCASNSYQQSQICFKAIKYVLRHLDPKLKNFKLNREHIEWLNNPNRSSSVDCLSNNPDKLDGLNASCVIMDEYSQADSADLYNVLTTSMGIRENPLVAIITTASDKPDAPFAHTLTSYKAILRGELENDRAYIFICEPDADDAEDDVNTWKKVQPHWGITIREDWYIEQWKEAQMSAENMKAFRTKLLNVFDTGNDRQWINGDQIRDVYRDLNIDAIGKAECEVAVDLSVDNDFSAVSYWIYLRNEKKAHIHTEYYLPEETINNHRNKELYRTWANDGHLHICKGKLIDYAQICNDIIEHGKYLHIYKIGFDPNKSKEFQNIITASTPNGAKYLYPYKQTYYYFTSPCIALKRSISEKHITFNPNPINAYCFDNCVLDIDRMDNCKPMKRGENLKIDGAITALMAQGMADSQIR